MFPVSSKPTVALKERNKRATTRPILFLDVDGVISLFGFNPTGRPPGAFHSIDGILHCIGADAARDWRGCPARYELVWATGWEEKANEYLVHILEMPAELPVLTFDGRAVFGSSHWKLDAIDEYARGAPGRLDRRLPGRAVRGAGPRRRARADPARGDRIGLGITDERRRAPTRLGRSRLSASQPSG